RVVVGLAVGGGPLAAGGDAALVADVEDAALVVVVQAAFASDVERCAGPVHHDGDDRGVTGQAA
ncbi:MAG: hypothetical protein QOE01_462, partial [Actinomycetota bacterium]|nr:hypothetical protein [Actinomycetota bacterium]